MPAGRPLKFQSVEELQERIDFYFANTPKEEWTITGLALELDTSRKVLMEYEEKEEFSNTIKRAKCKIENIYELRGWKNPSSMAIFALKNFDWKDKSESELYGKGGQALIYLPQNKIADGSNMETTSETGTGSNINS